MRFGHPHDEILGKIDFFEIETQTRAFSIKWKTNLLVLEILALLIYSAQTSHETTNTIQI